MATLVFVGKVERIEYVQNKLNRRGWIRVIEPFKGVATGQIVETAEWDGDNEVPIYLKGDLFVFYLNRGIWWKQDAWSAGVCGQTGPVEARRSDLEFLRALPGSAIGTRLGGRIVEGSTPLPRLKVTIQGRYTTRVVYTDANGFYECRGLPPGIYEIQPAVPRGMKVSLRITGLQLKPFVETDTITLDPDEHVLQHIHLRHSSSIGGRILDRQGRPLRPGEVDSIALEAADTRGAILKTTITPSRRYTLHAVPPGRYRVFVLLPPTSGGGTSPAPIYYPGTTDRTKAQDIDVTLDRPNPVIDITVPVTRRP